MPRGTWPAGVGAALLLAGCAAAPKAPAPAASPAPQRPSIVEPSATPAPPPPASWEDRALAGGDWHYSAAPAAAAEYGEAGAPVFSVRCDPARRSIVLDRSGAAGALTVRTTFGSRQVSIGEDGRAALPLADPLLDELVSSRGRVAVEAAGQPALIVPTWPEPARVVEECRG